MAVGANGCDVIGRQPLARVRQFRLIEVQFAESISVKRQSRGLLMLLVGNRGSSRSLRAPAFVHVGIVHLSHSCRSNVALRMLRSSNWVH